MLVVRFAGVCLMFLWGYCWDFSFPFFAGLGVAGLILSDPLCLRGFSFLGIGLCDMEDMTWL